MTDFHVEIRVSPRRFEDAGLIMVRATENQARRDAAFLYDVDEADIRLRRDA